MQWISEKDKRIDSGRITRDVGRHTSTHGLAADNQTCRLIFGQNIFNDRPVTRLEFRLWIRHTTLSIHVFKVELDGKKATVCKFRVEVRHERRMHSLPGAVSKDDCSAIIPGFRF